MPLHPGEVALREGRDDVLDPIAAERWTPSLSITVPSA